MKILSIRILFSFLFLFSPLCFAMETSRYSETKDPPKGEDSCVGLPPQLTRVLLELLPTYQSVPEEIACVCRRYLDGPKDETSSKELTIDDLPNDAIYLILEFLPYEDLYRLTQIRSARSHRALESWAKYKIVNTRLIPFWFDGPGGENPAESDVWEAYRYSNAIMVGVEFLLNAIESQTHFLALPKQSSGSLAKLSARERNRDRMGVLVKCFKEGSVARKFLNAAYLYLRGSSTPHLERFIDVLNDSDITVDVDTSAAAQDFLSFCYLHGIGVSQNEEQAIKHSKQACVLASKNGRTRVLSQLKLQYLEHRLNERDSPEVVAKKMLELKGNRYINLNELLRAREAFSSLGQWTNAVGVCRRLGDGKYELTSSELKAIATTFERAGNYRDAAHVLDRILSEKHSESLEDKKSALTAHRKINDESREAKLLQEIISTTGHSPKDKVDLYDFYVRTGNFESACEMGKKLTEEIETRSLVNSKHVATMCLRAKKYSTAVTLYHPYKKVLNELKYTDLRNMTEAYLNTNNYSFAAEVFTEMLKDDPTIDDIRSAIGNYVRLNQFLPAAAACVQLLKHSKHNKADEELCERLIEKHEAFKEEFERLRQ